MLLGNPVRALAGLVLRGLDLEAHLLLFSKPSPTRRIRSKRVCFPRSDFKGQRFLVHLPLRSEPGLLLETANSEFVRHDSRDMPHNVFGMKPVPLDGGRMSDLSTKEAFELYENGKHRRYNLLFSVNGGAFAIAKLLTGEPGNAGVVLGKLTLSELSIGMALFTVVMIADIYAFGDKMRKNHLPGAFALVGKIVLLLLGVLVCAAWLLVGFGSGT